MRLPPSSVFAGALVVLGAFPAFEGPFPSISLDTLPGKTLYLGSLIALAIGYVLSDRRENSDRAIGQKKRDALSDKRHLDDMAATAKLEALVALELKKLNSVLAAIATSTDSRQMGELVETAKASAATIGSVVLSPGTGELVITGYAPEVSVTESKTPLFAMPRVSSSGKPPA